MEKTGTTQLRAGNNNMRHRHADTNNNNNIVVGLTGSVSCVSVCSNLPPSCLIFIVLPLTESTELQYETADAMLRQQLNKQIVERVESPPRPLPIRITLHRVRHVNRRWINDWTRQEEHEDQEEEEEGRWRRRRIPKWRPIKATLQSQSGEAT